MSERKIENCPLCQENVSIYISKVLGINSVGPYGVEVKNG